MEDHNCTENQAKIIEGMKLVYQNLIAYKKKIDRPLVVMRDGKIVYIKPWEEK